MEEITDGCPFITAAKWLKPTTSQQSTAKNEGSSMRVRRTSLFFEPEITDGGNYRWMSFY